MKFRAGHKSGYTQLIQHSGTMPISSHFFRCILSLWILSRARGYVRKVSSFCLKSGFLSDFEGFWVSGLLFLIIEGLWRFLSSPFTVACVTGAKRGGGGGGGKARKRGKGKGSLMVFTLTSSNCTVKMARFYEFLFTLGWRSTKSKSLYKFPFP